MLIRFLIWLVFLEVFCREILGVSVFAPLWALVRPKPQQRNLYEAPNKKYVATDEDLFVPAGKNELEVAASGSAIDWHRFLKRVRALGIPTRDLETLRDRYFARPSDPKASEPEGDSE
jgi:hypothetical protein